LATPRPALDLHEHPRSELPYTSLTLFPSFTINAPPSPPPRAFEVSTSNNNNNNTAMSDASAAYRALIRALDQAETESLLGKKFIPDDKFDEVFTFELLESIAKDLLGEDDRNNIQVLYHGYRKTIAILVWMTWESCFVKFWNDRKSDQHLPLDKETLNRLDSNLWWPKFDELQYKFLARWFSEETESQQWSEDFVLPIIAKEWRNKGGFSTVFRIKIHPRYDFLNYHYEEGDQEVFPSFTSHFLLSRLTAIAVTLVCPQAAQEF
jgi:hypothetical protein